MTHDVVGDTTRNFILRKRGYLELAFIVAEAVPLIRDEAAKNILRPVEKYLRKRFDCSQWKVEYLESRHQPQAVRIKKHSWQCGGGWPDWEGVRLDRNWDGANVSVSPIENVECANTMDIFHNQNIGMPRMRGDYVYCGLEGNLKDWNGADFVFSAWHKPKKIAKDLAKKLEKLAQEIDKALPEENP